MFMCVGAYLTPTWFSSLNDQDNLDLPQEEPAKKKWVIQKLPIKGGNVLRSAMQTDLRNKQLPWVQDDGESTS